MKNCVHFPREFVAIWRRLNHRQSQGVTLAFMILEVRFQPVMSEAENEEAIDYNPVPLCTSFYLLFYHKLSPHL